MPYTLYSETKFNLPEKGIARLRKDIAGYSGTFQNGDKIFFEFNNSRHDSVRLGVSIYGLSEEKKIYSDYISFRNMKEYEKKAFICETFDILYDESEKLRQKSKHSKILRSILFGTSAAVTILTAILTVLSFVLFSSETLFAITFPAICVLLFITVTIAPFEEINKRTLRNVLSEEIQN